MQFAYNTFHNEFNLWPNIGNNELINLHNSTEFPLYDEMYRIIDEEIAKFGLPKPVLVSWLTKKEKETAKDELNKNPLPNISSIKDRFEKTNTKYPNVKFDYFG